MTISDLKIRIEKANEKVQKKLATIDKKEKWIASGKKDDFEVKWLQDDIKRLKSEIAETEKTIEKYEKQLSGEIEQERILFNEIPESMKLMQTELVERWDAWDIERRNRMKDDYRNLGWKEYQKKYRGSDVQFKDKTDEQIHNSNIQNAKYLIIDLYYRVKKITGEVTDWSGIRAARGACGMVVLLGFVTGKEGRAEILPVAITFKGFTSGFWFTMYKKGWLKWNL